MLFSNKSQITLLNVDGRARVFRRGRNICAQRYDRYYGVCVITQFYPINQRISIVHIYRSVVVLRALAPTNCSAHNTENTIDNKGKRKPKGKFKKISRETCNIGHKTKNEDRLNKNHNTEN